MIYVVKINDKEYEVEVEKGSAAIVNTAAAVSVKPTPAPAAPPVSTPAATPVVSGGGETIQAPMPGTIFDIKVAAGSAVKKGDILLVFEAMKMENEVFAPRDAVVTQVFVTQGAAINTGDALIAIR